MPRVWLFKEFPAETINFFLLNLYNYSILVNYCMTHSLIIRVDNFLAGLHCARTLSELEYTVEAELFLFALCR